jgi:hypothetical protein
MQGDLEMNERAVLAIFSITAVIGIGVVGVSRSSNVPASNSVAKVQTEDANYKLSSSATKTVVLDRTAELSAYRLAADMVLFFEKCDASSISEERQGVMISKFGLMPNAILRKEAKETEARRIETIPARENLPGGWVSFCKIMSDNVARGLYSDAAP